MLLEDEGSSAEHLVDPHGEGSSDGYALASGQVDCYADRDTVVFEDACHAVTHFIEQGAWPSDVRFEGGCGG
ncbi:hypothetical protein [Streptomyces sp. NPDC001594]|uniref:hypothetical protein n=1 Tax=Streptomyces sp. NPDC001594 TaxID=3364590 RepID=UPI003686CC7E